MTGPVVLAIDVGGSGMRWRIAPLDPAHAHVLRDGADADGGASDVQDGVLRAARAAAVDDLDVRGVAVGSRGAASLLGDPHALAARVSTLVGSAPVTIAADIVTAHLGVLGGRPGAVVAVGTGAIALGADASGRLVRAGGWGPLYDDLGSGYWIGAQALSLAARRHDGIRTAVDATALLDAARELFGPVPSWPQAIYPQADRTARIAGFARAVSDLAGAGDEGAASVITRAAEHAAGTLAACVVDDVPARVGATGGVARGAAYRARLETALVERLPGAEWIDSTGTPLEGAVILARRTAAGEVRDQPGLVWSGSRQL